MMIFFTTLRRYMLLEDMMGKTVSAALSVTIHFPIDGQRWLPLKKLWAPQQSPAAWANSSWLVVVLMTTRVLTRSVNCIWLHLLSMVNSPAVLKTDHTEICFNWFGLSGVWNYDNTKKHRVENVNSITYCYCGLSHGYCHWLHKFCEYLNLTVGKTMLNIVFIYRHYWYMDLYLYWLHFHGEILPTRYCFFGSPCITCVGVPGYYFG